LAEGISINDNILDFIKKMLCIQPSLRPSIAEVINCLLEQVCIIDKDSYVQLSFLINYFEVQSTQMNDLKTQWPYLFEKWEKFKKQHTGDNACA
jgi:eukaryotic-like serine/threonine-protein kinase